MKDLFKRLKNKKKEISKQSPVYVSQKDFSEGTYLVEQSGYYVLTEDIVFNPNPDNDYLPKGEKYSGMGFTLGFFACVAISAKDVYFDLNGYSISASPEFTLQQRFFSIIELANAPFLMGQGPGNFSNGIVAAENVIVGNGTLGRSSHHGIHGNMAKNVLIEDLKIKDFEFVGIALNGGGKIVLKDIKIGPNKDIPVLATYSAARFAKKFADKVLETHPDEELVEKLAALQDEMDITFEEVMAKKTVTSDLFRSETGLPDGNVYGVVIKNRGVAVDDFIKEGEKIKDVCLCNVDVNDLRCKVDEVIALSTKGGKGACVDSAGAVFQIDKVTEDGKYSGTTLSELQLHLTKLGLYTLGKPLGKNNIGKDVLAWVSEKQDISKLLNKGYKYKYSGDSMRHFSKGIIGYRFDAIHNLKMKKCKLHGLYNEGRLGDGKYEKSFDKANRKGYFGAHAVGVNISYCSNVKIKKCGFENIFGKHGDAIGINVIFKSDVILEKVTIKDIKAGTLKCGKWVGENYHGRDVKYRDEMPNLLPRAIGVRIDDSMVHLDDVYICDLHSLAKPVKVLYE